MNYSGPVRTAMGLRRNNNYSLHLLAVYLRHECGQPTPTLVKYLPFALGIVGVPLTPHFIWTAKQTKCQEQKVFFLLDFL